MRNVSQHTVGDFLRPDGYARPARSALLRERAVVAEVGRYALRQVSATAARRTLPYVDRAPERAEEPVLLVPGFLAGDGTLGLMSRSLRQAGHRTYRSRMRANIGCTLDAAAHVEQRLEQIADRRESRVRLVGHSLGGMIARGVAARRPDLVSGVITLGSPVMAPGAHHGCLSVGVDLLVRLTRAGVPGLMTEDCVAGECAREGFEQARTPLAVDVDFAAVWSRRDGFVDPRACIDPEAAAFEVTASHVGMMMDPRTIDVVLAQLRTPTPRPTSVVEVDRGEVA